jgi:hypothetical protein
MGEKSLGIFIAFTAMSLVTVETESIIEAFGFLISFLNKPLAQCFKILKFVTLNFEVGHESTTFVLGGHSFLLSYI